MDENDLILNYLKRNAPYVSEGDHEYSTDLNVAEPGFRQWVTKNKVPFDPNAQGPSDYDMRGFYHGAMTGFPTDSEGNPKAQQSVNPNDKRMHYSDYWKTPYHETFSDESQWAASTAPKWNQKDQLISPGGKIVKDERNRYPNFGSYLNPDPDLKSYLKGY